MNTELLYWYWLIKTDLFKKCFSWFIFNKYFLTLCAGETHWSTHSPPSLPLPKPKIYFWDLSQDCACTHYTNVHVYCILYIRRAFVTYNQKLVKQVHNYVKCSNNFSLYLSLLIVNLFSVCWLIGLSPIDLLVLLKVSIKARTDFSTSCPVEFPW